MDSLPNTRQEHLCALPPTSSDLALDETRPYFLWWTDCTVGELRAKLAGSDPEQAGYWLGAMLREANSRDVWLFTNPDEIRQRWSTIVRHLGRSRAMWAWLLGIDDIRWPPAEESNA